MMVVAMYKCYLYSYSSLYSLHTTYVLCIHANMHTRKSHNRVYMYSYVAIGTQL